MQIYTYVYEHSAGTGSGSIHAESEADAKKRLTAIINEGRSMLKRVKKLNIEVAPVPGTEVEPDETPAE